MRAIIVQLRDANRNVEAAKTSRDQLKQRRQQRRTSYSTELSRGQEKQRALHTNLASETSRIEHELKSATIQITEKRRSLAAEEANEKRMLVDKLTRLSQQISALAGQQQQEMAQLDMNIGSTVRGLEAQLQQTTARLDAELHQALKDYQDQIVNGHLHRYPIEDAMIPGIGVEMKRRLAQAGFSSAGDIATKWVSVPGIGPKKWDALTAWRLALDRSIRSREAPQSLPSHKSAGIEQRYNDSINRLQQGVAAEKARFTSAVEAIKRKYSDRRNALGAELASEESAVRQQTIVIERKFEAARNALLGDSGGDGAASQELHERSGQYQPGA